MKLRSALAGCAALVAGCTSAPPRAVPVRPSDPSGVRPEEAAPGVDTGSSPPASAGAAISPTTEVPTATEAPTTTVTIHLPHATTTTTLALPEKSDAHLSDVEWLIRQTFPEDSDRAVRIAMRESGMSPGASNGQYAGLMQIGTFTHADLIASMGYSTACMYSAAPNLAVARRLFDAAGWSPWA